jgi:hypothetical protein
MVGGHLKNNIFLFSISFFLMQIVVHDAKYFLFYRSFFLFSIV